MDFKSIDLNNFQDLSKDEFKNITKNYFWHQIILTYNKSNELFAIIHLGEKVKRKSTNQLILEKLDKIDERLTKVESRLDNVESRLDRIENRMENIESEATRHGWNI